MYAAQSPRFVLKQDFGETVRLQADRRGRNMFGSGDPSRTSIPLSEIEFMDAIEDGPSSFGRGAVTSSVILLMRQPGKELPVWTL
jgi:hypothetical protein